eukprot:scaffold3107_cov77-Skeletonema_dohrnii-CCMP3373.AAC.4
MYDARNFYRMPRATSFPIPSTVLATMRSYLCILLLGSNHSSHPKELGMKAGTWHEGWHGDACSFDLDFVPESVYVLCVIRICRKDCQKDCRKATFETSQISSALELDEGGIRHRSSKFQLFHMK